MFGENRKKEIQGNKERGMMDCSGLCVLRRFGAPALMGAVNGPDYDRKKRPRGSVTVVIEKAIEISPIAGQ